MALLLKEVDVAKDATSITVVDDTDWTGFTDTVDRVIFTISALTDGNIYSYLYHTPMDVFYHDSIVLKADDFADSEGSIFADDVYDINDYIVIDKQITGFSPITAGDLEIVASINVDDYNFYDTVVDNNNNIYMINKNVPFDADKLTVIEPLKVDITTLNYTRRGNVKVVVDKGLEYKIGYLLSNDCGCKETAKTLFFNKEMAHKVIEDFTDYKTASQLLNGTFNKYCC